MATIKAMSDPGPLRSRILGAFVTNSLVPETIGCSR